MTGQAAGGSRRAARFVRIAIVTMMIAAMFAVAPPAIAAPPHVGFDLASDSIVEADGIVNVVIELTTDGAPLTAPIVFDVVDAGTGTAAGSGPNADYSFTSPAPPLQFDIDDDTGATRTAQITVIPDALDEGPEDIVLELQEITPDGIDLAANTYTLTILDNDTAGVSVSPTTVAVSEAGATQDYVVSLGSQPAANVSVTVTPNGQLRVNGATTLLLTFTPGDYADKTVTVSAFDDAVVEGGHSGAITHTVASADPNYDGYATAGVSATITDNDFGIAFELASSFPPEGDTGTTAPTVNLVVDTNGNPTNDLGPAAPAGATVQVARTGGTATAADYTFVSPATIPIGGLADGAVVPVTVTVIGDTVNEADETVVLGLQNALAPPSGSGVISPTDNTHTVTILDDDGPPGLSVIDATPVTEGAGVVLKFTVALLPAAGQPITVNYATANGTAIAGNDYTALPTTPLTFDVIQGTGLTETTKEVLVPVLDDALDEIGETVLLNLSDSPIAPIADAQAVGEIRDDDNVDPAISLFQTLDISNNPMFQFGTGDTVKIRVNFTDPGIADAHSVTVNWGDGSAPTVFPITPVGARSFERTHRFAAEGFFQISASIADGDGGSGADERFVTVSGPGVGTGNDTAGLVDPTRGVWRLYDAAGTVVTEFYYGVPGDYPFMGDWDGDGIETPGLYRQADGYVYLRNSNTQGIADIKFFFGDPGDVPIAGDFNGDGLDTVSIYRPSNQRFYIINKLGSNDGGLGAAEIDYVFGNPGDKPFVGDFDGDGIETAGLHRESTGLVYFRNSHTQGNADHQFIFGDPGDKIVAGDWNGDTIDAPAVYRTSDRWFYFRHTNTQGNSDSSFYSGVAGWIPVAGMVGL